MRKSIKLIVCTIIVIAVAVWIVDKIPFTQKLTRQSMLSFTKMV